MAQKQPSPAQRRARAEFIRRFVKGRKKRAAPKRRRAAPKRRAAKKHHVKASKRRRVAKGQFLTHRGQLYRKVPGNVVCK